MAVGLPPPLQVCISPCLDDVDAEEARVKLSAFSGMKPHFPLDATKDTRAKDPGVAGSASGKTVVSAPEGREVTRPVMEKVRES